MSTQASTWPKGLYHLGRPIPAQSATAYGETKTQSLTIQSALGNGAGIVFTAFFAAEVAVIVAGIGVILASLVALTW